MQSMSLLTLKVLTDKSKEVTGNSVENPKKIEPRFTQVDSSDTTFEFSFHQPEKQNHRVQHVVPSLTKTPKK